MDSYDVIVIGSGLGGMTSANILAKKFGYKVAILEQHFQLGGLATWFTRNNHIFDVSLHGFPVGMIKTCKKYWSKKIADKIVKLDKIVFDNPQFKLCTTFDILDFKRHLRTTFNVKENIINDFFDTITNMEFFDGNNMTNKELFQKFFPDRNDIVRFLMEPITYANGSTLDEPALTYGIVFSNFMSKGVFTFQGGTDALIKDMTEELIQNGVNIFTRSKAEKIIIENNTVKGVITSQKKFHSRCVISNGNLISTIKDLAGTNHFSKEFMNEVNSVKLNNSSTQVYIGIKKGEHIDDIGDLIFTSKEMKFVPEHLRDIDTKSRTFSIYYPKTRPGSQRYSIVASSNANYEDWAKLTKDEYKLEKKNLCERTINHLEDFIPKIREKIDYIEAATPKTFERYTLHLNGASFGTKYEGLKVSNNINNNLSGLFHTGSVGIIMSGWLGAANYGVITANDVDKYLS